MKSIQEIRREILPDLDADLSWLKQKDAEMGKGFETTANERLAAYDRGDWQMVGVRAVAVLEINGVTQTISSPGLWGIESDSAESYFTERYSEQLIELCRMLIELGFKMPEIIAAAPELQP